MCARRLCVIYDVDICVARSLLKIAYESVHCCGSNSIADAERRHHDGLRCHNHGACYRSCYSRIKIVTLFNLMSLLRVIINKFSRVINKSSCSVGNYLEQWIVLIDVMSYLLWICSSTIVNAFFHSPLLLVMWRSIHDLFLMFSRNENV